MGFPMRKVEGRPACRDDIACCEAFVHKLHQPGDDGLAYGDLNRYNFVVEEKPGGKIYLVGLGQAQGLAAMLK